MMPNRVAKTKEGVTGTLEAVVKLPLLRLHQQKYHRNLGIVTLWLLPTTPFIPSAAGLFKAGIAILLF